VSRDAVLVTGATGLVGAEVVKRLVAMNRPVVAVTHRRPRIVANDGRAIAASNKVRHVAGDVRIVRFGLDEKVSTALTHTVGCIVHCAATTAFNAPDRVYDELNIGATRNAIALGRRLDVPLVHVSTAYVCGRRDGTVRESEFDRGQSFGNGYERSKFHAEQLVRAADGLRWTIIRPGIVTGATETGAIRDYKNFYTVLKLIVEGKLRTLPGRYEATLSLVPVDHVADVVVAAIAHIDSAAGRTFHAVGVEAISLRAVSDVLAEYPSFEVATFVPHASFSPDELDGVEREYYLRIGAQYTSYFDRRLTFDATNAVELLGRPLPATGKDYLRILLDHCLDAGYLGSPLPTIDEILAVH